MNPLKIIWLKLRSLGHQGEAKQEIDEELRFHIEKRTAENITAGMSPEDAAREARRRFGNLQSVREECRETRGASFGEQTLQDIRFGLRMLRKNPGFTAVAVLTLALGIGANTAIFSVVNAVLLRPMPYPAPEQIVAVCESNPRLGLDQYVTSMGAYVDWRRQNSAFQQLAAAMVLGPAPVMGSTGSELVHVAAVSADFFPLLGFQPILGQVFNSEEESPDRGDVILLSESLWRERFGADPGVLNQRVTLGDRSFTVVGVMPASVKLFDPAGVQGWDSGFSKSDLWRPLPVASGLQKQRNYRAFLVLGRLKPNVSLAQAQTDMANIAMQQARDYPESNAGWNITVQPWQDTVVRQSRWPLILLLIAVGFVLLVAASNLANLCLARATARQKEFAIRLALGAGRIRMARQFLAESLLLSALGGMVGLLFARWSISVLGSLIPANVPRADEINLDVRVLGFTFITALVTGLCFGLTPLLTLWRNDVNGSLKPEARGSTDGRGAHHLRAGLVTAQVALVMILLTGAGLLTRSFQRLNEVDPGFQPHQLVALDVSIGGPGFTNKFRRIQFVEQMLTRLSQQHEGNSAAMVDGLPLDAGRGNMDIAITSIEGSPPPTPDQKLIATLHLVSPGYFQTMGISFSRGRAFTGWDNTNAPPVVVVNQSLARQYFFGYDPIGKYIGSPDFGPQPCEIVGVIRDVRQRSLDAVPGPEVFRPLLQECFSSVTIVARANSGPAQTFAAIPDAVSDAGQSWPTYNQRTLDHLLSTSLAPRRFALVLMGLFAGLALLLATVGIHGVLSCVIHERTREIGIRLALGAQRREMIRLILSQGMRSVAVGGLIGLIGACLLTRLLRNLLYEVNPLDPFTLVAAALLLLAVALLSCWLPARRASKVDPMVALRHE